MSRKIVFDGGRLEIVNASFAWLDDSATPWRIYAWCPDVKATSTYIEYVPKGGGGRREVIVHNLYNLGMLMKYWNIDVVEAILLSELHELTHWAMTEYERHTLKLIEQQGIIRHSEYWNPLLLEIIRSLR